MLGDRFKTISMLMVFLFVTLAVNSKIFAAEGDSGSGITVGPPVVEYTIEKGDTKSGFVKVNDYNPVAVTLYPQVSDFAVKNETGQPAFFETDPDRRFSLSSWIKFSPEPISLEVGELREIQYQIVVPEDAEPGGHYGVLFFSTKSSNDVREGEAKVATNLKVGQLILVKVPGAISEKASVATFKTGKYFNFLPEISLWKKTEEKDASGKTETKKEWRPSFTWDVGFITRIQNNGNIHFKPRGEIRIKNLLGNSVVTKTVNSESGNVLPESVRLFENTWKPAWWQVGYFKGYLDLTFGADQTLDATVGFWVIPLWLVVITLIFIFLMILRIRRKRKTKSNKPN